MKLLESSKQTIPERPNLRYISGSKSATFSKYAENVLYEKLTKSFETPKGSFSCSENASNVRIQRAEPHGSDFLNIGSFNKRNLLRI